MKKHIIHHLPIKTAGALLLSATLPGVISDQPALSFETKVKAESSFQNQAVLQTYANYAKPIADQSGLYPSVMIAQAILESNWGQSSLSSAPYHNLFGIKGSYQGNSVYFPTQEYLNNKWVTVSAAFRAYPTFSESFQDNANLLRGSYYRKAWRENTSSYRDATAALTGTYATDPSYGASLNRIIQTYGLDQYDGQGSTGGGNVETPSTNSPELATDYYTVKAGDSLWKIAQTYGMTVQEIKSLNNLSSDMISVGQKLKVHATGNTQPTPAPTPQPEQTNPSPVTPDRPTPAPPTNTTSITVKSGDTLWGLAQTYKTSVAQLKALNGLQSDVLYIGQTLKVPQANSTQPTPAPQPEQTNPTPAPVTPSQPAPTPQAPQNDSATITVKSGDTLWGLAQTYKTSVAHLKALNGLSSDMLYIGQTLKVPQANNTQPTPAPQPEQTNPAPAPVTPSQPAPTPTPQAPQSDSATITVKSGDTLWDLAQAYHTTVSQIKALNHLNSDLIIVGQQLKISQASTSTNQSKPAAPQATTPSKSVIKIKSGDTLWQLAQDYHTSVDQLKAINHLNSDLIIIGQYLKVK